MMASFNVVDYLVFISSLIIFSLIGVFFAYKNRHRKSNAEFLFGSRRLDVGPVCFSLMASFLSAGTILGYPAEIYLRGAPIFVSVLSSVLATICAAKLMMPVFYRLQLTSMHSVSSEFFLISLIDLHL